MWLPAHCWCQLLIQIADLNCWCQLIADEDDEGSVLCGEFGRQRYLDHLDRKDLRIFPDLESIQHMLISLAPSYFWFPAAICHLILLTLWLAFPLLWPLWTRICKDLSWLFSGYLSVWLLQYLSRLWSVQDELLPKYSHLWQCICTTSKFASPLGSRGGLCCAFTRKKLKIKPTTYLLLKKNIHSPVFLLFFLYWQQVWRGLCFLFFCLSVFCLCLCESLYYNLSLSYICLSTE